MQHTITSHQTAIAEHNRFLHCINCDRCKTRKNVCLWRGRNPADILLVGSEPDFIDDRSGIPLGGINGAMLDQIVQQAIDFRQKEIQKEVPTASYPIHYCVTTKLSCFSESVLTLEEEQEACLPRLLDLIKTVNPRLIVLVGIEDLININVQQNTPLEIEFLAQISMVRIADPESLSQRTEQIGKEQVLAIFRQQVSIIVNALRRL